MSAPSARRQRARRGSGELLRREIVDATRELLAETASVDAVSIRAVASRVGVTPPSIYLHFADKDALLDAAVTDVFADLDATIVAAGEKAAGKSPFTVLLAQGVAYVRFALEHREHYRVAAMEPCVTPPDVDEMLREGAFAHFLATVQQCMDARIFAQGDPLPIALDLWTAAHGIAALLIAKPYLPWGDVDDIAVRALRAAGLGHALEGLIPGDDRADHDRADVDRADHDRADVDSIAAWLAAQRPANPG